MGYYEKVKPELTDKIYTPRNGKKMHCVAFASGSGTNFEQAVLESKVAGSFLVDLLITDKKKSKGVGIGAITRAKKYDIPIITVDGFKSCGSWQEAKRTPKGIADYEKRSLEFNYALLKEIQTFENEAGIEFDLAILAGYMRLFKGPLLRRFNNKAINVHPADLTILNPDGTRKYTGDDAVYDALKWGEKETNSSIILVDAQTDAGAILVSGPLVDLDVKLHGNATKKKALQHQNKQKELSDWPALRFALEGIANGNFALHKKKFHPDGNPYVVYNRVEMPYDGWIL